MSGNAWTGSGGGPSRGGRRHMRPGYVRSHILGWMGVYSLVMHSQHSSHGREPISSGLDRGPCAEVSSTDGETDRMCVAEGACGCLLWPSSQDAGAFGRAGVRVEGPRTQGRLGRVLQTTIGAGCWPIPGPSAGSFLAFEYNKSPRPQQALHPLAMNTPLLPASAAALCAALLLLLVRHLFTRPIPTSDVKDIPRSDVEKGETLPPSYVSDIKVGSDVVNDVWPPVEPESDEPAPTIGSALPDVALVWGLDYSFEPRTPMSAVDRRPLTAYSHIASALGVDEPEPMRSQPAPDALNASTATDTRPMRSRSLVSGIVSDWNSLSQSEKQAWATLSEAKSNRSSNSRTNGFNS